MSDAGPPLRPRGSNHVGMRQFNERVVLQAIRLHGQLPKAEIARLTRLTPQTIQLIMGRLEADGLVLKLEPLRGKVGQPSVPMALNPDGAYSIGIQIGRRRLDMLLVDFVGQVRERLSIAHDFPDPDRLFSAIESRLNRWVEELGPARAALLHGIGVAAPLSLEGWQTLLGADGAARAAKWAQIDIQARVAAMTEVPVMFIKDTAAACVAELVSGQGRSIRSYLYVYVDTFIGGGLVIDSHLHLGRHGNAGAIGSMPLVPAGPGAAATQLLHVASLFRLESLYASQGLDPAATRDERALSAPWLPHTQAWMREAAQGMAGAIGSAACLLDLDGVIVDGAVSRSLLQALLAAVEAALDCQDWEGVLRPPLRAGSIGSEAQALGGALLPIHANFAPDRELFLKIDE